MINTVSRTGYALLPLKVVIIVRESSRVRQYQVSLKAWVRSYKSV
jgi:hypothetical protein